MQRTVQVGAGIKFFLDSSFNEITSGGGRVNNMVSLNDSQALTFEPVRLDEVVGRAIEMARPKAQRTGLIMAGIYQTLLTEIARDGYRVLDRRTSLTPLRKLFIAWKTSRAA